MNIAFSNLAGFPVQTKSGKEIGKISDCIIDKKTHGITHYEVKTGHLTSRRTKLIHISQVIEITDTAVVVKDGVVFEEESAKRRKRPVVAQGVSPSDV